MTNGMSFDEFLTAWSCTRQEPVKASDQMLLSEIMGERPEMQASGVLLEQLLAATKTNLQRAHK